MSALPLDPHRYINRICVPQAASGRYAVVHYSEPPGQALSDFSPRTVLLGQAPGMEFTFSQRTQWHRLVNQEQGVWMTDQPIEQRQMEWAANQLTGRVLVGGLGLGILPVILAEQQRVTEVVVVERSRDVIRLVQDSCEYMMAVACALRDAKQYCHLRVIHQDLFRFFAPGAKHAAATWDYDSAYFDIWQGDNESTFFDTVLPLLQVAYDSGMLRRRPVCWNEDVMRGQLRLKLINHIHYAASGLRPEVLPPFTEWGKPRGNKWFDWMAPLWAFIARQNLTPFQREHTDTIIPLALSYAAKYGDPWARRNGVWWWEET